MSNEAKPDVAGPAPATKKHDEENLARVNLVPSDRSLGSTAERQQADSWQPISTAPKDTNHNVLVFCASNRCTYTACWDGAGWNHFGGGLPRPLFRAPTHWMPLPAPPTEKHS